MCIRDRFVTHYCLVDNVAYRHCKLCSNLVFRSEGLILFSLHLLVQRFVDQLVWAYCNSFTVFDIGTFYLFFDCWYIKPRCIIPFGIYHVYSQWISKRFLNFWIFFKLLSLAVTKSCIQKVDMSFKIVLCVSNLFYIISCGS